MRWTLAFVLITVACGKSGGSGSAYKHSDPNFQLTVPADLTPNKNEHVDGDSHSLDLVNEKDSGRDILLVWAKSGSPTDPAASWDRHHHHDDARKIVEEGDLPGGGKFITIDRGALTFAHALITTGGYSIECTTSDKTEKPDPALLGACKTLAGY